DAFFFSKLLMTFFDAKKKDQKENCNTWLAGCLRNNCYFPLLMVRLRNIRFIYRTTKKRNPNSTFFQKFGQYFFFSWSQYFIIIPALSTALRRVSMWGVPSSLVEPMT
ncbi:MAG: hypothetical protein ABI763_07335, partial [Bacteroidota bacterium]